MACLVDNAVPCVDTSQDLVDLVHNPMFTDLQATLASDCVLQSVPYVLVQEQKRSGGDVFCRQMDLLVEDATLQAEFRQLAPLGNVKVAELETFYNTQSAAIMTHRSDALSGVHRKQLLGDQTAKELDAINLYYNEDQGHLTLRISKSLQLLKGMLPSEQAQPGGATKKNKVRQLNTKAVTLMTNWYEQHTENPYPTGLEKGEMAKDGQISMSQVKAWFANKRNRSMNTRPKREKQQLQKQLTKIWQHLTSYDPESGAEQQQNVKVDLSQNYSDMLDNLAGIVQDKTPDLQYSNFGYGSIFGDLQM